MEQTTGCPICDQHGYFLVPVCCGKPDHGYNCCGCPEEDYEPCPYCEGNGYVSSKQLVIDMLSDKIYKLEGNCGRMAMR